MKRTLIAAIIGFAVTCFSVPAIADSGGYMLPPITAGAQVNISLGCSADQATTPPGTVALGEDSIAIDPADVKTMIGGADVLAFSNPSAGIGPDAGGVNDPSRLSRIGGGNSNYSEIACANGVIGSHGKHEVSWQIPYSA